VKKIEINEAHGLSDGFYNTWSKVEVDHPSHRWGPYARNTQRGELRSEDRFSSNIPASQA
jgi:hypothetical protein